MMKTFAGGQRTVTCGACGGKGHNRRGCKTSHTTTHPTPSPVKTPTSAIPAPAPVSTFASFSDSLTGDFDDTANSETVNDPVRDGESGNELSTDVDNAYTAEDLRVLWQLSGVNETATLDATYHALHIFVRNVGEVSSVSGMRNFLKNFHLRTVGRLATQSHHTDTPLPLPVVEALSLMNNKDLRARVACGEHLTFPMYQRLVSDKHPDVVEELVKNPHFPDSLASTFVDHALRRASETQHRPMKIRKQWSTLLKVTAKYNTNPSILTAIASHPDTPPEVVVMLEGNAHTPTPILRQLWNNPLTPSPEDMLNSMGSSLPYSDAQRNIILTNPSCPPDIHATVIQQGTTSQSEQLAAAVRNPHTTAEQLHHVATHTIVAEARASTTPGAGGTGVVLGNVLSHPNLTHRTVTHILTHIDVARTRHASAARQAYNRTQR